MSPHLACRKHLAHGLSVGVIYIQLRDWVVSCDNIDRQQTFHSGHCPSPYTKSCMYGQGHGSRQIPWGLTHHKKCVGITDVYIGEPHDKLQLWTSKPSIPHYHLTGFTVLHLPQPGPMTNYNCGHYSLQYHITIWQVLLSQLPQAGTMTYCNSQIS